jgi:hypothetical protein
MVKEFILEDLGNVLRQCRDSLADEFIGQVAHVACDGVVEMELSMARAIAAADAGERISLRGDEDEVFMTAYVARKVFPKTVEI